MSSNGAAISMPTVVPPSDARINPLTDRSAWQRDRAACLQDPGRYHGEIARRELHWFDPSRGEAGAWIRFDAKRASWIGHDARSGDALSAEALADYDSSHYPWATALDTRDAPFFRWFSGALTNACFNEVDRHVLEGHGAEIALWFEGDRWDQSLNAGRGGPVTSYSVTRQRLMFEVARCAIALERLGLRSGDRVAINMPNIPEQIYWTLACKRLGVVYTPVFGGFSDKTLSDRIHNAGARVVITADGGFRNAQIVAFKEAYTDPALDGYVPIESALKVVTEALQQQQVPEQIRVEILQGLQDQLINEITLERSDVMRVVGQALERIPQLASADASRIRTALASALVAVPPRVDTVVVVRHTGQPDLLWRPERDRWAHELLAQAEQELLQAARAAGHELADANALCALDGKAFCAAIWSVSAPRPLDAEFPLFFIYTSGSTGKPKGVVHVHGGYVSGVAHSMRVAFDAQPGDVMYVVADPGWITGQSYMICGALATRVTTIIAEGAPVFPSSGRFASIIERYRVNIFKAGVTFLKSIMSDPQNIEDVRAYSMDSLRVATFCAEPTSPAVQEFGMKWVTPWYINSYWATEHGGIVWTHFFGNADFPLRPDAHTYPLPWVLGDVWVADSEPDETGSVTPRVAADGEKGEIIIEAPYPYLCRTIWGDTENFVLDGHRISAHWRGDIERYTRTYWQRWQGKLAYTQGDFAVRHADGSFSLHGRSDDVINVSGHRLGTEEIEGAILRDKQIHADSPVGNVIVVGAPHAQKGLTPLAFVVPAPGRHLAAEDRRRLIETVRQEKGQVAIPEDFIEVKQFPETRSGKYMRRMVRALVEGQPVGDTSTLRNPDAIDELAIVIRNWQAQQRVADEQQIFEDYRYFRVQYHDIVIDTASAKKGVSQRDARIALVIVRNPPVNALNERALDELNIVVDHLARRDDVKVIIFTGSGTSAFVAGADIRQLLEDVHTLEEALPLPNNAHLAFRKIESLNKPAIAAINGVALGGGMEFAMACHIRVAEPLAQFGQPEVRLNLLPGYGGTQRLPRLLELVGHKTPLVRALEVLAGGRTLTAAQLYEDGILQALASPGEDVVSLASRLAIEYVKAPSGRGLVAREFTRRKAAEVSWQEPGKDSLTEAMQHPLVQALRSQAEAVDRSATLQRIFDAVRTGWQQGLAQGLKREAQVFAEAIVDPAGGKAGIQAFFDKQSAPLPVRFSGRPGMDEARRLQRRGQLLPVGAAFFPGLTPMPIWQYGHAVVKDSLTGAPAHGLPQVAEQQILLPVPTPAANEAVVYVLASEVNFNDIWAITGIPVSPFDNHDLDYQVTGSGGIALIASLGEELKREGRLKVGDLVTIYSGQSELLSPLAGRDPMYAGFSIQGYETDTGSHQQFLCVQGPQLHPVPPDLSLEAAGSYVLNLGTVVRALFTTLKVQRGRSIFIEGSATGTGFEALKSAARHGLCAIGGVSSAERAQFIERAGAAGALNRRDKKWAHAFCTVPDNPEDIRRWEADGAPLLEAMRAQTGGRLADYVVSHAGEQAFARSFQLLAEGGKLTFYGATSGYWFSFVGKAGSATPESMLERAELAAGEAVLLYYGVRSAELLDATGLEAIEAVRAAGARLVVATYSDAQREFVQSLGFGEAVRGVVSLEEIQRKEGADFEWPDSLPRMPDSKTDTLRFKEAVRRYQDRTMKPFGSAIGRWLRSADNPRGYPDLIIERAGHDALAASTSLIKPFTGRVVYCESMQHRRYTFYAPQVWMRQRRIFMPTATIAGTHLCNAYEVTRMNDLIAAGRLDVSEPMMVPWDDLPSAHQAMWDNTHAGANYVLNHALPCSGLKSRDELYQVWGAQNGR
jgi:acrylyl-CoA reductase (NADPH)/3-hydroxypropionyl-CoA dehydratase/3-hydroxypropionyl-CoA synthetase